MAHLGRIARGFSQMTGIAVIGLCDYSVKSTLGWRYHKNSLQQPFLLDRCLISTKNDDEPEQQHCLAWL
jgi:hypothetical protein